MRRLPALVFVAALLLLLPLAWIPEAGAQPSRPAANGSLAQAERNALELKQGMSVEEVERLLGKPRRTAMKANDSPARIQGPLQWTYSRPGSSGQGTLQGEFAAKAPQAWYVDGWEWRNY